QDNRTQQFGASMSQRQTASSQRLVIEGSQHREQGSSNISAQHEHQSRRRLKCSTLGQSEHQSYRGSTGVEHYSQQNTDQDQDQSSITILQRLQDRLSGIAVGNSLACNSYDSQTYHDQSKGKECTTRAAKDGSTVGKQSYCCSQPKQFNRVISNVKSQE